MHGVVYFSICCRVKILPEFQEIARKHFTLENIVLDVILDKKYKEFRLLKKRGNLYVDKVGEHYPTNTRFIDLQKEYPHSEIKAKSYKGKITKYEVIEKVKLSKLELKKGNSEQD